MPQTRQASFAAGEITPALHSNVSLAQYQAGLAYAENWFVSVYGGLLNRPGTRFLDEVEHASRLIPFQLGERQGYALEFGNQSLRFYTQGARLTVQPVGAAVDASIGNGVGAWANLSTGGATIQVGAQLRRLLGNVGTTIGDLPLGGGIAAAFDGDVTQAAAFAATSQSYVGFVGKSWGAPKTIHGFVLHGTSDLGLTGRTQNVTVILEGSNSGFTVDVTQLGAWSVQDRPGLIFARFTGITVTSAFGSHRIVVIGAATGPVGTDDTTCIAEVQFYDKDIAQPSISLVGAAGGLSKAAYWTNTDHPGREHVLRLFVSGAGPVTFQVGNSNSSASIVPARRLLPGWHLISFTPGITAFFMQFQHGGADTRDLVGVNFVAGPEPDEELSPKPLLLPQPYLVDDLPAVTWTQDANILTLFHDRYPTLELRRGLEPLSWSLTYKRIRPAIDAPAAAALSVAKLGSGTATTTHTYVVTYVSVDGEESLPSGPISVNGVTPLTRNDYSRVSIAQPLPPNIVACQVYKLFGGAYGLMGLCVAQFDDIGQAPKVDDPPPEARDPFAGENNAAACGAYWEQRLAMAGSVSSPETVEVSQSGRPDNFGRSSPPREDDAITFTPKGERVRRIRHMLGGQDLLLFSEGSVLVARRGESALTPALEGGVQQVLARGISGVRPMAIDTGAVFVGAEGRSVRLLDANYAEVELSLASEHLFRGRTVVDWAYAEAPWSLLWLAMSDGKMVVLSLLARQGIVGWTRASTSGLVGSLCAVSEGNEDVLYLRTRRWLRGGWRWCIERMASRQIDDVRDAYFLDCGLSLDDPRPIVALGLTNPATITVSNFLLTAGDVFELDDTGLADLDGKRFRALSTGSNVPVTVGTTDFEAEEPELDWSNLGPWRGEGVLRKTVSTVGGAAHLAGETVMVLNDGNVEGPYTVDPDGDVPLARRGARVHIGLAYSSEGETLDVPEGAEGSGRRKAVNMLHLRVRETRGLKVGPRSGPTFTFKPRRDEAWGEPTRLRTELIELPVTPEWGLGGRLRFVQDQPLPAELVSLSPLFNRSSD